MSNTSFACSCLSSKTATMKVSVAKFNASCFFCRKCGEEFSLEELVPERVCPDLFFQIYPQYLSLLYNGKPDGKSAVELSCPGTEGKTYWRLSARPQLLSPFINIANWFFHMIGKPKDAFDRKIVLELLRVEGHCPRQYRPGLKLVFNQYSHLWGRRFFCPAVFYTLYPLMLSWRGEKEKISARCPADYTSIVFEIKSKDAS